jgi:hypothetical protein
MPCPGAATDTHAPWFENEARVSWYVLAPTAITPGKAAG